MLMRRLLLTISLCILAACTGQPVTGTSESAGNVVLYEGARLIPGDGSAAIEDAAFTIADGRITRMGHKGEVGAPAGATRVDLSGKTVMPTLIGTHVHPGFQKGLTYAAENYTRENI